MKSDITLDQYGHCKKWLRYYLDFCKKYTHSYTDSKSLLLFLEKLKRKKQTPAQRAQAKKAVELYYAGVEQSKSPPKGPVAQQVINDHIERFRFQNLSGMI